MHDGDITRSTFDPSDHYSSVRMQQGRVQLDADWNEQLDIQLHRDRAEVVDAIGTAGAPKLDGGFALTTAPDGSDLLVQPGRMWVDGLLCELGATETAATVAGSAVDVTSLVLDGTEITVHSWVLLTGADGTNAVVRVGAVDRDLRRLTLAASVPALTAPVRLQLLRSYGDQPHLPRPPLTTAPTPTTPAALALDDGAYLAYLDVWTRGVTVVEAPGLAEPALGGPDTTTRTQTVWQVRLLALDGAPADVDCASDLSPWTAALAPPTGAMVARAVPPTGTTNLCTPTPAGGFVGLENQLYRVQVRAVDGTGRPQIVWSRDNGSVVTTWTKSVGDQLTVASIGRDRTLGFAGDQWVELLDDGHELTGQPGTLVRLLKAEGTTLTVDASSADGSIDHADFAVGVAKIRRWDSDHEVTVDLDTWVELEDGVQVQFSQGSYRPGDHWLVPARPAIADVDWPVDSAGTPLPRPPMGTEHRWAPLAIVKVNGATVTSTDCRALFPSLTTLTATDVAFDDVICAMPGVANVQQALDRLCQQRDLRRHHKLLHGWGIVCGLQVHCGPDDPNTRGCQNVTLLPGTAIDVEGNDLDLVDSLEVDLITRVEELRQTVPDVLDADGNGDVCMWLQPDREGHLDMGVEKLDPAAEETPAIFQGTLLLDFYNDCIKSLHDWLREELQRAPGDTSPVSPAQERVDALINLIAQPVNGKSGANIFLSPREDKILQSFYQGLRQRLQSETFCAMFDNARVPPTYPAGLDGINTIFGIGGHTRLRLRPGANEAYTVGAGLSLTSPTPLIHRYDLRRGRLAARIDPVAGKEVTGGDKPDPGTNAATDVAFSPDGRSIYVIVPAHGEDDTLFRVGDIADDTIRWRPGVTICGVKLVTLAVSPADPRMVYAVGLRKVVNSTGSKPVTEWHGAGIYRINPEAPDANTPPLPIPGLFPVGHLVIDERGNGVATSVASDVAVGKGTFDQLTMLSLPTGAVRAVVTLGQTGTDDIALVTPDQGASVVYAVVQLDTGRGKGVVGFDARNGTQVGSAAPIDLQQQRTGAVRLFAVDRFLAAASGDEYLARVVDTSAGKLVPEMVIPLQVGPIASAADTKRGYVLNYLSNTISVIDLDIIRSNRTPDLAALAAYRKGMIEAYGDLLAGFVQYLKDCFFDHFLVRCPQPSGTEKIYLACASIRSNSVYKVCNFSRRRYVKSFPTIGYWLSAVPLIPLAKQWLGKIACSILPEYMSRLSVNDSSDSNDRLSVQQLQQLLQWVQSADVLDKLRAVRGSTDIAGSAAMFALSQAQVQPAPPSAPRLVGRNIVDQPIDEVSRQLQDQGLAVVHEPFEAAVGLTAPVNVAELLRSASPGDEVTLYEDGGIVRYYRVSGRAVVDPSAVSDRTVGAEAQVTTAQLADRVSMLERELTELRRQTGSGSRRSASAPASAKKTAPASAKKTAPGSAKKTSRAKRSS